MTDEEAKTKWCPFARPAEVRPDDCGEVRGNRNMNGTADPGALCLGSGCMAWRFTDKRAGRAVEIIENPQGPPDLSEDHIWVSLPGNDRWGRYKRAGYCGLASKP